jgi:YVTN family beta-propeller protein
LKFCAISGQSARRCHTAVLPLAALVVACVVGPFPALAQNAYITNSGSNTVSVINTATNMVIGSPIPVGSQPAGVAITPDGSEVYVGNQGSNTVSVIDTATATVIGSPTPLAPNPSAWQSHLTGARSMSGTRALTMSR